MTVINLLLWVYQISSKSDDFSLRYDDFTIFNMADVRRLEFYGSNNGFFESPRRISYWLSIKIVTLDSFFLENRILLYEFWRQTDEQTNIWTESTRKASGGLKIRNRHRPGKTSRDGRRADDGSHRKSAALSIRVRNGVMR